MSRVMPSWLRRYWAMLIVLTLGFTLSGWLGWQQYRNGVRLDIERFRIEAMQMATALEMTMERYEERLARLADHCALFEELPKQVWSFRRNTVIDLQGNLPAVMLAVYCPKVASADFLSHAERGRVVWGDAYRFDPAYRNGRDVALPVWQNWNRSGVSPVPPGTDMMVANGTLPSLQSMLPKSRAWSDAGATTVQRADGQVVNGFWFGLPLYAVDQMGRTPARRVTPAEETKRSQMFNAAAAKGVFAVFLSTDYLLDRAFNTPSGPSPVHVRLFSSPEPRPETLMNPASAPPANPRHRTTVVLPWYGLRWCVEVASTPWFEADSAGGGAWLLGLGGAGFTVLATVLVGMSIRARWRQERLTAEITEARNTLAVTERERQSLGDDLHDGAIQSLYAIQLGLTRTARDVADALPSAARVLDDTRLRVDVVIAELRRFIHSANQRWAPGEVPSLEHVLASVVQSLRATTSAELSFEAAAGSTARLSSSQSVTLAQLARSALGNALRHADATRITVRLVEERDEVVLTVEDNGKGFSVAAREHAGLGITSMRKRAAEAGGELRLQTAAGTGTKVEVRLRFSSNPGNENGSSIS